MERNILPLEERVRKGRVAVIECIEEFACNPCAFICKVGAIRKEGLTKPPRLDWDKCVGCALCVGICPGLAIFCIQIRNEKGYVTMPYELLPKPEVEDKAILLNRFGEKVGIGKIAEVRPQKGDPAFVITVEVPSPKLVYEVRAVRIIKGGSHEK
jgi:Fe-S-cluster-containing hydrogenase component 2